MRSHQLKCFIVSQVEQTKPEKSKESKRRRDSLRSNQNAAQEKSLVRVKRKEIMYFPKLVRVKRKDDAVDGDSDDDGGSPAVTAKVHRQRL